MSTVNQTLMAWDHSHCRTKIGSLPCTKMQQTKPKVSPIAAKCDRELYLEAEEWVSC
jgi:hypothetical protein